MRRQDKLLLSTYRRVCEGLVPFPRAEGVLESSAPISRASVTVMLGLADSGPTARDLEHPNSSFVSASLAKAICILICGMFNEDKFKFEEKTSQNEGRFPAAAPRGI